MIEQLLHLDRLALEPIEALRWAPLTAIFVVVSTTFVKGPIFVALGWFGDLRARRVAPVAGTLAAVSLAIGSLLAALLKESVDRPRPVDTRADVEPLVTTPDSPSFPSGHATTAFAAAAAVAAHHPRLRWHLYALATLVALSRIYLGVHFWLDVLAGAALGIAIGLGSVWCARRLGRRLRPAEPEPARP